MLSGGSQTAAVFYQTNPLHIRWPNCRNPKEVRGSKSEEPMEVPTRLMFTTFLPNEPIQARHSSEISELRSPMAGILPNEANLRNEPNLSGISDGKSQISNCVGDGGQRPPLQRRHPETNRVREITKRTHREISAKSSHQCNLSKLCQIAPPQRALNKLGKWCAWPETFHQ